MRLTNYAKFAWGVVALNILVIIWGAVVSATGSGAGCGDHWPVCNGQVIPLNPATDTLIEYTHRLTSGLALLAVGALWLWGRRAYPASHPARAGAWWSLVFIIIESLLGAGLVVFRLTAADTSVARALVQPVHLINTMILLGWLTLTAWWASGGAALRLRGQNGRLGALAFAAVSLLVISGTGSVISLGDLLFETLGIREGPVVETLVSLRVGHPLVAIAAGAAVMWALSRLVGALDDPLAHRLALGVNALMALQWMVGSLNVVLRVPLALQLTHLFLADLAWLLLVILAARALSVEARWLPASAPQPNPATPA